MGIPLKVLKNYLLIRLLAEHKLPLLFPPGTNLMYSGTGFTLLASLIEKLSGQAYKTYLAEQVFTPLGMTHTQVVNGPRSVHIIPGLAEGFVYSDSLQTYRRADSLPSAWPPYLAGITGEGMILTTTGDLLKWDRGLKSHRLLQESTQQQMLSVQAECKTVPAVQFGYGMLVGTNGLGPYAFHNGFYPGYVSMHIRYLAGDITAIVLSNNESHADFIADALVAITAHQHPQVASRHQEYRSPQSLIRMLAGISPAALYGQVSR